MTSEPITPPSSNAATPHNVLLIVDAESLLSRYPQPSLEPQNPTEIEEGFVLAIGATINGINDSIITLPANTENTFHIRGRTISLLAEHSVVFYDISIGDAGVLSVPELVVHDNLTVPAPDPANPTQPGSQQADDHYWHCTPLATGLEACELSFMLIDKNCEALGYFCWAVDVNLME
jgi:hypothetical protein